MRMIPSCDTQAYPDGYAIAFSNIRVLKFRYDIPISYTHRESGAYILTDCPAVHCSPMLGEHYALCIHDDANSKLLEEIQQLEEVYPVLNDEHLSLIETWILGKSLSAIFEMAAEDYDFYWLYRHYTLKYFNDEPQMFCDCEQYGFDMKIIEACGYFNETSPIRFLQDNVIYTVDGARLPTAELDRKFAALLRHCMFQYANNIRKERLHGWKKNWGTLL